MFGRSLWCGRRSPRFRAFPAMPTTRPCWPGSRHFTAPPQEVFVTHGEVEASLSLANELRTTKGWNAIVPEYQQVVDLG